MWRVAGVGLLLLMGCNQIFGLTPAKAWEPDPHVTLTWQLATTTPAGAPDPVLTYPPLAPGFANIQIATLDGELAPAAYSSSDGSIEFPSSYLGTTWRLEYTLPGAVPREVQWKPGDGAGHLTVPIAGRIDRKPVPVGSGYTITPSNYSGGYTSPRLLTTGLWTDGTITSPPNGSTVDYDFPSALSTSAVFLSGPNGGLDASRGDLAALVDFAPDAATRCLVAVGSASLSDATLQPSMHTAQTVPWDRTTAQVSASSVDPALVMMRLQGNPLLGTAVASQSRLWYGAVPSIEFPGLSGIAPQLASVALPSPVMHALVQCPYPVSSLPPVAIPAILDAFPGVVHVQLAASRQVLGATLNGGLETVVAPTAGGFKIVFPAPLATTMTLNTPSHGALDLSGPSDQLAAGSPTGSFTLDFTLEQAADLRADYHDVVLHRIVSGALTPVRIFTVTAQPSLAMRPSVRIDREVLRDPGDYVFEIRTYRGHRMAPQGDFAPVEYPYGAAIVFTRTFTIP